MLQSRPHILTKSIVIIIENANKSNGFGQSMGGTSTSRSKGLGYHEIEQEASSLVDISHRQVYCLELGDSIISKSSKKPKVLLNGFLTKYLLTWQKTPSARLPLAERIGCSVIPQKEPRPAPLCIPWLKGQRQTVLTPLPISSTCWWSCRTWEKKPSHEELESFMPWAPYIQQEFCVKNSDAYVNTYLD